MDIKNIDFKGVKSVELSAGKLRVVVTTEVGPRIIFFGFINGENMLKEFEADFKEKSVDKFVAYGGHRLWTSPEDPIRTYEKDTKPVEVNEVEDGVSFTSPLDTLTGLQKTMVLTLSEDGLNVCHIIENKGQWPVEFACWGITQMKNGGVAIIPRNQDKTGLLPNGNLVLWDYTKMNDSRLYFGEKYITVLSDDKAATPTKIGVMNTMGHMAYINDGNMFVKHFFCDSDEVYPDYGCNCESYSCKDFVEVESVSYLTTVGKGEVATGYEFWELYSGIDTPKANDEKAIAAAMKKIKPQEDIQY